MPETDQLAAARAHLAGLLTDPDGLPGEVSLDVCAALFELDLTVSPLDDTPRLAIGGRPTVDVLRGARAAMRAALPSLAQPGQCLHLAEAVGHVDDALAGLVRP